MAYVFMVNNSELSVADIWNRFDWEFYFLTDITEEYPLTFGNQSVKR